MQFCFTFDYFIQFLYLKTNPTDLQQLKITVYFICICTLLYLFVLLLVVRLVLLSLFLLDNIVFP